MPQELSDSHPIVLARAMAGLARDLAGGMELLYGVFLDDAIRPSRGMTLGMLSDKLAAIDDLRARIGEALIQAEDASTEMELGPGYRRVRRTPVLIRGGWRP